MTPDLQDKVILITGASRGIGRAVALAAAKAGAEIIMTGRTMGALEETDDAITAAGGKATIVELDMADYGAMPRLAAAIHGRWGRLDGLLANAAMLGPLTH
jgi:NAD(P)-dependent dehydrogenase (short-subunit alcohol dehydrogenase family)